MLKHNLQDSAIENRQFGFRNRCLLCTALASDRVTCFMFFGQLILLFWTAGGELSDVEERFREAR